MLFELKSHNGRKGEVPFLFEIFGQSADVTEENLFKSLISELTTTFSSGPQKNP